MKRKLTILTLILTSLAILVLVLANYSVVFSKSIAGEVIGIERVAEPTVVLAGDQRLSNTQVFSFAVALKQADGEIFTASSEDRQWAVVHKGQCVVAKFFPYPFWHFEKSGTFFGARLLKIQGDCAPTH